MYDAATELRLTQAHQQAIAKQIKRARQAGDQETAVVHGRNLLALRWRRIAGGFFIRVGKRLQGAATGASVTKAPTT